MKKLLFGFFLSLTCSAPALADWEYREKYDEMRDVHSYSALLFSELATKSEFMSILLNSKDNETINSAGLVLRGYKFNCESGKPCDGFIKFDNSSVYNLTISADNNSTLAIFDDKKSFLDNLQSSNTVFIEVPVSGNNMKQFKFITSGLKWKVAP